MTALETGAWRELPIREKQYLRDRLAEECARNGIPINDATSPGILAMRHEPTLTVQRPHLELIDRELTNLLATPNGKLMIFTPPQVGKSSRVSRWFPFWWLTHRPQDRVILGSYAAQLANTHSAACRDLINAHGAGYGLRLRDDESTRSDWTLTTGGGMRARGTRGGLTGNQMDLGIIDDPLADRAAADSPTIREGVWDWYSSAFISRMAPEARQVIVMTRWHQQDLAGKLLARDGRVEDGGEWRVLHLPALAMSPDPAKGVYDDPLGRAPGEPLSHPRIQDGDSAALNAHWTRIKKASTTRDWNALDQGMPFDSEGTLLTEEHIRAATRGSAAAKIAGVGVDPSGGGRDTAGIVAGHLGTDGKFYWTRDRTARMTSDRWSRAACELAHDIDADRIVVETNYGGDQATTLIRQAWDALQREGVIGGRALCPRIVTVHSRKSKLLRAEPIAQAVLTGRAFFDVDPSLANLKTEWQMWEPGSTWSPGALDAAVHLATDLLPPIQAGASVTSVAKRKRDSATARGVAARKTR
ncbi:terminase large subunit domain-containing protein [Rhodococcus sp. NPDC055112]